MKYYKFIIVTVFVFITGATVSCERDDICPASTPTTPRLIIDFIDENNTENRKNVTDLVVVGVDNNDLILDDFAFRDIANIQLPLKTDEDSTQYVLIEGASINDNETPDIETDDFIEGNYDTITINYTRELIFVSRACGFKTIYKDVSIEFDENDTDKWIINRLSANDNQPIEDETTTHFNLFH